MTCAGSCSFWPALSLSASACRVVKHARDHSGRQLLDDANFKRLRVGLDEADQLLAFVGQLRPDRLAQWFERADDDARRC
jgi:hypothetical protein